jgi:hypothetical protein
MIVWFGIPPVLRYGPAPGFKPHGIAGIQLGPIGGDAPQGEAPGRGDDPDGGYPV